MHAYFSLQIRPEWQQQVFTPVAAALSDRVLDRMSSYSKQPNQVALLHCVLQLYVSYTKRVVGCVLYPAQPNSVHIASPAMTRAVPQGLSPVKCLNDTHIVQYMHMKQLQCLPLQYATPLLA